MKKKIKKFIFYFLFAGIFLAAANFAYALEAKYPKIMGLSIDNNSKLPEYAKYFFNIGMAVAGALAVLVIVFGGHLGAGEAPLITLAESFETPLGSMEIDSTLAVKLKNDFKLTEDIYPDNTVEIQMPLVKYLVALSGHRTHILRTTTG